MLRPHTVYGFAHHEHVDEAIFTRLNNSNPDNKQELAELLGQAVDALRDINLSIPVQSKHRHLVAGALEKFANG